MDDDDYRELIDIVVGELRASGAAEIADERHYIEIDAETGETRLIEPRRRLTEMLEAFDRVLAVQDRRTYSDAMAKIDQVVEGAAPGRVLVEFMTDAAPREVDLSEAPDLSVIRKDVFAMIVRLRDGDLRPGGERV